MDKQAPKKPSEMTDEEIRTAVQEEILQNPGRDPMDIVANWTWETDRPLFLENLYCPETEDDARRWEEAGRPGPAREAAEQAEPVKTAPTWFPRLLVAVMVLSACSMLVAAAYLAYTLWSFYR